MLVSLSSVDPCNAWKWQEKKITNQATTPQSDTDEEKYIVEKNLDLREKNGEVEYLLKWIGLSDDDNTGEPKRNSGEEKTEVQMPIHPTGFDRNMEAEKILGATDDSRGTSRPVKKGNPPMTVIYFRLSWLANFARKS
ncbi:hypothetical protein OUZ56_015588 [Daphnia magna]|uniref:Chromo domain-containing protein n=1 Tax=Daphnia magna TaxID=35525 RepID=A0ABR0AN81_9CRUS|nr:hypothetical protein OUZ56_015588 [Daphnia magna]